MGRGVVIILIFLIIVTLILFLNSEMSRRNTEKKIQEINSRIVKIENLMINPQLSEGYKQFCVNSTNYSWGLEIHLNVDFVGKNPEMCDIYSKNSNDKEFKFISEEFYAPYISITGGLNIAQTNMIKVCCFIKDENTKETCSEPAILRSCKEV